jgi:hypothetical protein
VAASAHKNPSVRKESLLCAARCMAKVRTVPPKADVKALADACIKALDDSDPEVRDAAAQALGTTSRVCGERAYTAFTDGLDKLKQDKVKQCYDDAVVAVRVGAAQAPAAVAATAAQGRLGASFSSSAAPRAPPAAAPVAPPATSLGASAMGRSAGPGSGAASGAGGGAGAGGAAPPRPAFGTVASGARTLSSSGIGAPSSSSSAAAGKRPALGASTGPGSGAAAGAGAAARPTKPAAAAAVVEDATSTLSDEQVEERALAFAPESLWQGLADANWKTRLQGTWHTRAHDTGTACAWEIVMARRTEAR